MGSPGEAILTSPDPGQIGVRRAAVWDGGTSAAETLIFSQPHARPAIEHRMRSVIVMPDGVDDTSDLRFAPGGGKSFRGILENGVLGRFRAVGTSSSVAKGTTVAMDPFLTLWARRIGEGHKVSSLVFFPCLRILRAEEECSPTGGV